MSHLNTLVADYVRNLSGAEFKIAAYLYRLLEHQRLVTTTISDVAAATGLGSRRTQSALQSLANKGLLCVDTRHRDTRCTLPPGRIPGNTVAAPSGKQRLRMPANRSRPSRPPSPAQPVQAGPASPVPIVAAPTRAPGKANRSPAASATQDQDQSPREKRVHNLVRVLMGTRGDITPQDFNKLLAAADSNLDRLLARLQKLVDDERQFDNFVLLCSEVRSLVLIR